jgi:cytochrome c biogenesis protein CcmG/thiol:disulfide interchange protein DsbE
MPAAPISKRWALQRRFRRSRRVTQNRLWLWLPLALFAFFAGLAGYMLTQEKNQFVESAMIGEPLPDFALQPAFGSLPGAARADFIGGKPRLLNIWASWCLPCIAEAPQLEALKAQGVEIIGIAIRDRPEDVANFLAQYGNPYTRIGSDRISEVQLAIGSSGVPETFVIDAKGMIRYQHIGDIREDDVPVLLAELEKAQ